MTFLQELTTLCNRHCAENRSDTPDFVLAGYIMRCLENYDLTTRHRESWYGRPCGSGSAIRHRPKGTGELSAAEQGGLC